MRPSGGHAVVLNWSMYNLYGLHPDEVRFTIFQMLRNAFIILTTFSRNQNQFLASVSVPKL